MTDKTIHRASYLVARGWIRLPVKGARRPYWADPSCKDKVYTMADAYHLAVSRDCPGHWTSGSAGKRNWK
jgi:hypothetical protein